MSDHGPEEDRNRGSPGLEWVEQGCGDCASAIHQYKHRYKPQFLHMHKLSASLHLPLEHQLE